MARLDERKSVNDENVEPVSEEPRKGDVLGLSGSEVPKTPDPSSEYDPESISQAKNDPKGQTAFAVPWQTI